MGLNIPREWGIIDQNSVYRIDVVNYEEAVGGGCTQIIVGSGCCCMLGSLLVSWLEYYGDCGHGYTLCPNLSGGVSRLVSVGPAFPDFAHCYENCPLF
jgi:hypothetical protein